MKKICTLCSQNTIPKNVNLPAICWQCVMYFCTFPEKSEDLYHKVEDETKKRMLKHLCIEREVKIDGPIRSDMVRARADKEVRIKARSDR